MPTARGGQVNNGMNLDALLTICIFISLWMFIKWGFKRDEDYCNDNDKTNDKTNDNSTKN